MRLASLDSPVLDFERKAIYRGTADVHVMGWRFPVFVFGTGV